MMLINFSMLFHSNMTLSLYNYRREIFKKNSIIGDSIFFDQFLSKEYLNL